MNRRLDYDIPIAIEKIIKNNNEMIDIVKKNNDRQDKVEKELKDISITVNTSPEVVRARGGFDEVKDRLDYSDSQLETKANLNSVFSMSNMGQDIKEAMTGGSVAVVGKNAVFTENIVDKQITPNKTSFFDTSSNLFNEDTIIFNKVIGSDGVIVDNNSYFITDFIAVDITKGISLTNSKFTTGKGFNNLAQYDSNKNFINRIILPTTQDFYTNFNVNTKYIRLNGLKSESNNYELMINEGQLLLPYKKYKTPHLIEENMPLMASKNLFNDSNITIDKVILSDGTISDNTSYIITDFIPIGTASAISMTNSKLTPNIGFNNMAQYDENKNFISRITLPTTQNYFTGFNVNTRYIRFNGEKKTTIGFKLMVNKGSELLPYEPCGTFLNKKLIPPQGFNEKEIVDIANTSITNFLNENNKKYIIDTLLPAGSYSAKNDTLLRSTLENVTYTDVYSDLDNLSNQHGDYIAKTTLGVDSSGLRDINMYRLKPQVVSGTYQTIPKLILSFCVHGSEKPALLAMLNIVNNLCKNYNSSQILKFIRWNVDIILIPVANPTGYYKNGRTNANNVDINRNFDYKWDTQVSTEKGSSPNSEVETQYIVNILKNNTDSVAFLDFHTYGSTENIWSVKTKFQCADSSDKKMWTKIGAYTIRETTLSSWQNYSVNKDSGFIGTMGLSDTNNAFSINYAQNVLGINSSSPEACYKFVDGVEYSDNVNRFNIEYIINTIMETLRLLV